MTIKELLQEAGRIGDFPTVRCVNPVKGHPNVIGKVTKIEPRGIVVDMGQNFGKFFHANGGGDNRSQYMSELVIHNTIE